MTDPAKTVEVLKRDFAIRKMFALKGEFVEAEQAAIRVLENLNEDKIAEIIRDKGHFLHGIANDQECKEVTYYYKVEPKTLASSICTEVTKEVKGEQDGL